jgi:hypothetical protein
MKTRVLKTKKKPRAKLMDIIHMICVGRAADNCARVKKYGPSRLAPGGTYVAWKMSSGAAETLEGCRSAQRSFWRQTRVVRPRASSSSSREQRTAVAQVKATAAAATACSATPRTIVALAAHSRRFIALQKQSAAVCSLTQ